ncbi:MAG: FAD-dependent oxidoreductase [Solirubrobacterales bacterium]|nr:FAD-dependent oxidoreductase [Solirubrobacterales bacterium]
MPGLWLEQALAGERAAPPLAGRAEADVCIVGGGYTGLWTALAVKQLDPAAEVALVEARYCGYGASGRNQGQLLDWWAKLPAFEAVLGSAEALRLGRIAEATVAEIGEFCAANGIDADYAVPGWLWGATSEAQLGSWDATLAALAAHGIEALRTVGREEAVALSGSPRMLGGAVHSGAAVVQPAKLVRGLRRVALEQDVRIYERTPMTGLDRTGRPLVRTPGGEVSAGRVVLALNCWLAGYREVAGSMFVVGSDIAATPPIPERLAAAGLDRSIPLTDARMLLKYLRPTPDGRLVNGLAGTALAPPRGGGSLLAGVPSARRLARLEESLAFLHPELAGVPLTHSWTGPVDRSSTGLPFFGALAGGPAVLYAAGYSGNGVGPARIAGRVLAAQALGRDDEWARIGTLLPPPRGLPPEPLRYVGGRAVRAAIARRERLQDAGRRPDPLTARVAALAPAGVVPMRDGAVPPPPPAGGEAL